MSRTELRRIHRDSIEAIEEAQIRLSAAQNERVVVHQEDHVLAGMHELISSGYQICDAGSITAVIKEPSVCVCVENKVPAATPSCSRSMEFHVG